MLNARYSTVGVCVCVCVSKEWERDVCKIVRTLQLQPIHRSFRIVPIDFSSIGNETMDLCYVRGIKSLHRIWLASRELARREREIEKKWYKREGERTPSTVVSSSCSVSLSTLFAPFRSLFFSLSLYRILSSVFLRYVVFLLHLSLTYIHQNLKFSNCHWLCSNSVEHLFLVFNVNFPIIFFLSENMDWCF